MKNLKSKQIATHIGHSIVAFGLPAIPVSVATDGTPIGGLRHTPRIEIMSSDGCDEGAYYPSKNIGVYGVDAIRQLRDFCDEILNETKPEEKV